MLNRFKSSNFKKHEKEWDEFFTKFAHYLNWWKEYKIHNVYDYRRPNKESEEHTKKHIEFIFWEHYSEFLIEEITKASKSINKDDTSIYDIYRCIGNICYDCNDDNISFRTSDSSQQEIELNVVIKSQVSYVMTIPF